MKILLLGLLALLVACSSPRTSVKTDGQEGTIIFKVKPSTALVYVDGVELGKARSFNGTSKVLEVTPGTHVIEVKKEGYFTFSKKVYMSDTQEIIDIQLREK